MSVMKIRGNAEILAKNPDIKAAPHPSSKTIAEIAANFGDKNGKEYSYSKSIIAESILENLVRPLLKKIKPIQILITNSRIEDKYFSEKITYLR